MNTSDLVFLGTKGNVLAIDKTNGTIRWVVNLKVGMTTSFVTLLVEGDRVYAHTGGELFCLDAINGTKLWTNELAGYGYGLATLATEGNSSMIEALAEQKRRNESSHASGAATGV